MADAEGFILVGKISGTFGVKGWMKVFSFTEPRQNILTYSPLYMEMAGEWHQISVTDGKKQGKNIVLRVADINDPDQVLPLIGNQLAIKQQQLKPAGNNDFYWSQLIGMNVQTLGDEPLGVVDHLVETGANDVLVVDGEGKSRQHLIPFVIDDIVKSVDLENNVIIVDWGLDY